MKKFLLKLTFLIFSVFGVSGLFAQFNANNMPVDDAACGALLPMTTPTTLNSTSADDTWSGLAPIGFTFNYAGNDYTQFGVSPDGFVGLGAGTSDFSNSCSSFNSSLTALLAPRWDDMATGSDGYTRYELQGTAPNQQLVIEWFVTVPRSTSGAANANFQVILYEGTNVIQFRYGSIATTGSYTSGIFDTPSNFINYDWGTQTATYQGDCSTSQSTGFAGGECLTFTPTTESCPAVSNLMVSNITTSEAEFSWTENGTATVWDVEIVDITAGGTQTMNPTANDVSNPYTATGLSSGNQYEFYVRADCGADNTNVSAWSGPFAFITEPDFCNGDLFTDSGGTTGNYSANDLSTTIICPDNSGDVVTVDFTTVSLENCCDVLAVYNGSGTGGTVLDGDLESPAPFTSTAADGCITVTFDADGSVQDIGWEATVSCEPPASCLPPTDLAAANISATSADLAWTTGGSGETVWDVEIVDITAGGTQTMNPTANDVSNPYTATGLSSGNQYEFYVRADCGADNTNVSSWSGPFAFTTTPDCGDTVEGLCYSQTSTMEVLLNFTATPGDLASLTFISGGTEGCCDEVIVYDGLNGTGNIIFGATSGGGTTDVSTIGTVISTTENISLVINSDGSITCSSSSGIDPISVTVGCETPSSCEITDAAAAAPSACNPADNTYSVDVTVTYTDAPATGMLDVNGQQFAITSSPQTVSLTGLPSNGADVDVTAFFTEDLLCTYTEAAVFTAPADCIPGNTCENAIAFTPSPQGTGCDSPTFTVPFTTNGFTDSGVPTVCSTPGIDVWYTWTATSPQLVWNDQNGNPGIAIFASCADVAAGTEIDCRGTFSDGTLSGWNVGDELIIQIYDFNGTAATDISFCLEEFQPCTVTSVTAGTQGTCDPLTNEYSQDIEVSFVQAPTTGTLDVTIDGITASVTVDGTTTSPVTVTVNGLTADGASKDVTAAFSADAACTLTATDVYTAPAPCTVVCDITNIEDAGTGVMNCVGTTFDYEVSVSFINPPATGTLDVTAGTGTGSVAVNALTTSPQTVLITGITAGSGATDVTAAFSADGACTETVTGLFTAPTNCPPANDECVNATVITVNEGTACGGTFPYTTVAATTSGTDAAGSCWFNSSIDATVWFEFTLTEPCNNITVSTDYAGGSLTDTQVTVYDACGGAEVACDDDGGTNVNFNSIATASDVPAGTYYIIVDKYSSFTTDGTFCITVDAVACNDDCVDAVNLNDGGVAGTPTGTPVASSTALASASGDPAGSTCALGDADDDVWFTFTSDSDGGTTTITIVPDGSFSPVVEFYTGTCGALTYVLCEAGTSIDFPTGASQTIWMRVYDADTGFSGGGTENRAAGSFTIAVAGSALPAEITSFTGKVEDTRNILLWETAEERNTAEFAIERSLNGSTDWEVVATERAAGNSDALLTYRAEDKQPAAKAYYRLRTIDLDGSSQTTDIIFLSRKAEAFDVLAVAPNPTDNVTTVTVSTAEAGMIESVLTDVTGKVIRVNGFEAAEGLNYLRIDLNTVPSGIYFLSVNNGVRNVTKRVVKN